MDFFEFADADLGVDGGGFKLYMAQQRLDVTDCWAVNFAY